MNSDMRVSRRSWQSAPLRVSDFRNMMLGSVVARIVERLIRNDQANQDAPCQCLLRGDHFANRDYKCAPTVWTMPSKEEPPIYA
jgi:hypothetical protein